MGTSFVAMPTPSSRLLVLGHKSISIAVPQVSSPMQDHDKNNKNKKIRLKYDFRPCKKKV